MEPKPYHPMLRLFNYQAPVKVVYGVNAIERLNDELKRLPFKSALLVTGPNVCKTGVCKRVMDTLASCGSVEAFTVPPEPDSEALAALAGKARSLKPDLVVGLGGGSSLDMAKAASMLVANDKDPASYFRGERIANKGPPIVTIPTIAGTGSEVTPISVIADRGLKLAIMHYNIYPAVSIVDPALSLTASPAATASSGIDAICHAVESIMSVDSNPISTALAFDAIGLVDDFLERAYCNGEDIEARNGLSMASVMAGLAFSNTGLCLAHGMAYTYAYRGEKGQPHGASVSLAEPHVIEFNAPAIPEKIELIAGALGIDTDGLTATESGSEIACRILDIMETTGLPMELGEIGVPTDSVDEMVDDLIANHGRFIAKNPRKPSREDLVGLYAGMFDDSEE